MTNEVMVDLGSAAEATRGENSRSRARAGLTPSLFPIKPSPIRFFIFLKPHWQMPKASDEDYEKMSPGEKMSYARSAAVKTRKT